ncbi:hypothetical protein [Streptomyces sp. SP2-10]|nr:hypothetical protein [Streptomyces sp. SP2-10]MBY8844560.1 hypothetical protein [Streptomyces sp. SP2-10]
MSSSLEGLCGVLQQAVDMLQGCARAAGMNQGPCSGGGPEPGTALEPWA